MFPTAGIYTFKGELDGMRWGGGKGGDVNPQCVGGGGVLFIIFGWTK